VHDDDPVDEEYRPPGQDAQDVEPVAEALVPVAQLEQKLAAAEAYDPAAHDAIKPFVQKAPAGHSVHELDPATTTYEPPAQPVHDVAPLVDEAPAAQLAQLDDPPPDWYRPAAQLTQDSARAAE
jgi:hypothetical protein